MQKLLLALFALVASCAAFQAPVAAPALTAKTSSLRPATLQAAQSDAVMLFGKKAAAPKKAVKAPSSTGRTWPEVRFVDGKQALQVLLLTSAFLVIGFQSLKFMTPLSPPVV